MEALFRQDGIYSHVGQLYEPVDMDTLLYYNEAQDGQILEEGITEAGALSSFIAAGTAYAKHRHQHDSVLHLLFDVRLPARRRPDLGRRRLASARLPARRARPGARRWPAKACSIRTATATSSRCRCPTASPTIRRTPTSSPSSFRTASGACTGTRRASSITSPSEREVPASADAGGCARGHSEGMYRLTTAPNGKSTLKAQLLGSGAILNEAIGAQETAREVRRCRGRLERDELPGATSRRLHGERWNMLHPTEAPRVAVRHAVFAGHVGRDRRRL